MPTEYDYNFYRKPLAWYKKPIAKDALKGALVTIFIAIILFIIKILL